MAIGDRRCSAAATPPMTAGNPVVLWLGPFDAGALDGAALLEAVSVYTRDLNLETRTAIDVPPPTPAALAAGVDAAAGAAIRAHGGRLGFWCEPAPDAKTTALIIVDGRGGSRSALVDSAGSTGPSSIARSRSSCARCWRRQSGPRRRARGEAPRAPSSLPPGATVTTPSGAPRRAVIQRRAAGRRVAVTATPPAAPTAPDDSSPRSATDVSTPLGSGSIQQGAAGESGRAARASGGAGARCRRSRRGPVIEAAPGRSRCSISRSTSRRAGFTAARASRRGGGAFAAVTSVVGHGDRRRQARETDVLRSRGRCRRRGARARRARARHRRRGAPLHRAPAPEHDLLGAGDAGPRAAAPRIGLGLALVFPAL